MFSEEMNAFEEAQVAGFKHLESRLGALETFYREEIPSKYPQQPQRKAFKARPAPARPKALGVITNKQVDETARVKVKAKADGQAKVDGVKREPEECSICIEPLVYQRTSRQRCGHRFHNMCIKQWLETHDSCPICRRSIMFCRTGIRV